MSALYFFIAAICLIQHPLVSSLSVPRRSTLLNFATDLQFGTRLSVISRRPESHKLHLQFQPCEARWLRENALTTKSPLFCVPPNDCGIGSFEGNDCVARGSDSKQNQNLRHTLRGLLVRRFCKQFHYGVRMMGTSILRRKKMVRRLWCGLILGFTLCQVPSAHATNTWNDAVEMLARRSVASSTHAIVGGSSDGSVVVKKRKDRNPVVVVATVLGSGAIAFKTTKNIKARYKSNQVKKTKPGSPSMFSPTANTSHDSAEEKDTAQMEGLEKVDSSQLKQSDSDGSDGAMTTSVGTLDEEGKDHGNESEASDPNNSENSIMAGIENLAEAVEEQVTKDVSVVLDDEKSIVISQDEENEEASGTELEESSNAGVSSSILGMFKLASSVDRQEKRILASPSMGEVLSPQSSTNSASSVNATEHSPGGDNDESLEERGSSSDVDDGSPEARSSILPLKGERYARARMQPKPPAEEETLSTKYAAISSVEERAYQILVDLGMVEQHKPDQ